MATTTAREFTPASMKPRDYRGRTEKRVYVAGKGWQRPQNTQDLMTVFGRDAAIHVSEASIRRYQEATTLMALLGV